MRDVEEVIAEVGDGEDQHEENAFNVDVEIQMVVGCDAEELQGQEKEKQQFYCGSLEGF